MNNEHNPVAKLVAKIQQEWMAEVAPNDDIQWVRWLIKPEQARLYEGFLKLESTAHGSIPDIPVVLLTPFEDQKEHSRRLMQDWLDGFEKDKKIQEQIESEAVSFDWDSEHFRNRLRTKDVDANMLLMEMLESFQRALPDSTKHLVLSLLPYTIRSIEAYRGWMDDLLSIGFPEKVRLMVFDHLPENYFEPIQLKHKEVAKSLHAVLDLDSAMKQTALSGDPNDPELQFRQCMLEMGNSTARNNRKRLHQWGEKGLEITQRTGDKASFAMAHTVYAGMLFHFKEFETIDKLLQRALTIAKQGLTAGDDAVKPILLQTYGFMAASKQHQKEIDIATDLFCTQAETAISFQMVQQALTAYMTAYTISKKTNHDRYRNIMEKAYRFGTGLTHDQLRTSPMAQIAFEYHGQSDHETQARIDAFMADFEGDHWKEELEKQQANLHAGASV